MDPQQAATLVVVFLAASYLVRRTWWRLSGRGTGGCGACGDCPASTGTGSSSATPLVPLDALIASARRQAEDGGTEANEPPPERRAE